MGFVAPPSGEVAVGIDLGTAFSRVAVWRDGEVLLIPNERGRYATPSCVAFTATATLVGDAARDQVDGNMDNTIFAPQRLIGYKFGNPWVQWYMRSQPSQVVCGKDEKPMLRVTHQREELRLWPEDVVAILLKHLRGSAEKYLGREVKEAVITVPSSYGKVQREAILYACKQAGLLVRDLVKTATAAALASVYGNGHLQSDPRNYVVCDVGAAYFNYALITVEGGVLTERAIGTELFDLDACVTRLCAQDLRDKHMVNIGSSSDVMLRLRRSCEQAKRHLSEHYQACVEVKEIIGSRDYICHISREQFEALCADDIESLLGPINWFLEDLDMEKHDIHEVVLAGGCARIPRIRVLLRDFFFGKHPYEASRPDTLVVIGAAVYAASLSQPEVHLKKLNFRIHQVTPWATVEDPEELESERPEAIPEQLEREGSDGVVSFL
mmetsp:Transcript_63728/g.151916  ORF Transcript_63728/g.151916 Transcript_63728/m.151916 type:complete len:439 (-) Transcript_63728:72-1388(-)